MRLGRLAGRLRRLSGARRRLRQLCKRLLRHPYLGTMRPGRRVLSPIGMKFRCVSLGLRFGFAASTSGLTELRLGCGRCRSIRVIEVPALAQLGGEAMADVAAARKLLAV